MEAGTPFGRFHLIELLGRGGMGEVWKARDTAKDRVVALKVLQEHSAADRSYRARFLHEAKAAAAVTDPHVIRIYDSGDIDGRLFVEMDLVQGRELQAILAEGPLDVSRTVSIIEQVAAALTAAHAAGLTHRDVKPSNILLDDADFAYLIDFGIAYAADATRITSVGSTIGTWAYMAPERFSSEDVDPRSDVYALACVLYQCLTGTTPFPGDRFERQYAGHVSQPPPRPSQHRAGVPTAFDQVIARGMAKDPAQRYQSVAELASASVAANHVAPVAEPLTLQRETISPLAANSSPPRPKNRRPLVVAALLATLAIAGLALTMFVVNSGGDPQPSQASTASQEDAVRSTLQDFDTAIEKGDLTRLRDITCGQTHDSYAKFDPTQWAAIHARAAAARQYPVIASIDDVLVHGDQAEANVTTFMAYDPTTRSTRSFDLQNQDGQWKICQSPS